MRYILVIIALMCCSISSRAQTDSTEVKKPVYSVRHSDVQVHDDNEIAAVEEFRQRHLFQAGEAAQIASRNLAASIATSVVSGVLFGVSAAVDNDGARKGLIVGGAIMAGVSLGFTFCALKFNFKAGRELKLSAGEVVYKF